jgi:hypothetical protein
VTEHQESDVTEHQDSDVTEHQDSDVTEHRDSDVTGHQDSDIVRSAPHTLLEPAHISAASELQSETYSQHDEKILKPSRQRWPDNLQGAASQSIETHQSAL